MSWFGRKPQPAQPPQPVTPGPDPAELDAFGNHSPYNRAFQGGPKIRRTVVRTEIEERTPEPPQISEELLRAKWDKQRKRRTLLRDLLAGSIGAASMFTLDHTVLAPHTEPNYPHVPAAELANARDAATGLQMMQSAVVKPLLAGLNTITLQQASDAIAQMLILLPDGTSADTIAAIQAAGKALKNVDDALVAGNQLLPQLAQEDPAPLFNLLDKLPH